MKAYGPVFSCFLGFVLACQGGEVQESRRLGTPGTINNSSGSDQSKGSNGAILRLSWEPSTGEVSEYHVFGLKEEKNSGGSEFASLTVTAENKKSPTIQVKLSDTNLPAKGKVCFYVTAENNGSFSSASLPACTDL